MIRGQTDWFRRVSTLLATCALLAVTLFTATPSTWHPETHRDHCAICHATSLPFTAASIPVEFDGPVFAQEAVSFAKPVEREFLPIRNDSSRGPPA